MSLEMDPGGVILGAGDRLKLSSPCKMHAETCSIVLISS